MEEEEVPDLIDVTVDDEVDGEVESEQVVKKVPITIVTGYLGAGKTTLLNYILKAEHGKKIAVILNEFGNTADIEKSLTVSQDSRSTTEWIPLQNGCICCSVKDSGVNALESLVERQKDFDYILLETTGVADPGNIAPMFWLDEGLGSSIYLDGIVTVVDAKNIFKSLDEPAPEQIPESEVDQSNSNTDHHHDTPLLTTAHLQISHADVIILNKTDLITSSELSDVQTRLSSINSLAKIIPTSHSRIDTLSGTVLELYAYNTFPSPSSATSKSTIPDFSSKGHSHLDPTISTLTLPLPIFDIQKLPMLEAWLETVLWEAEDRQQGQERKYEIHRTKGLIPLTDGSVRVVQGVREIFEIIEPPPVVKKSSSDEKVDETDSPVEGKLVFIGRNLDLLTADGLPTA